MPDFQHMTDDEIITYIENYGTEEQRVLVDKLCDFTTYEEPDYDLCPHCADKRTEIDDLEEKIAEAKAALA